MSVVSVQFPANNGVSVSENPIEIPTPERSPNELDGYKVSMGKADAVRNVSTQSRKTPETKSGCVRS